MMIILVLIAIATGLYFLNLNYQYWNKRGVPGPKPTWLVGNLGENFSLKKSIADVYSDIYKLYQNAPFVGIFRASTPTLIIRDPELIRDITGKSFQHFHDNDFFIDKDVDPISGRNPFFLRGEDWKRARAQLTPGFTSGKMKWIYPLLEEVSKNFVKYIEKHPTATTSEGCKAKELCMRFTLNNVGSCVFGLDAKCFEEDNPEFKQIADRFLTPEGWQSTKVFIISIIPVLAKFVSIKFTPSDVEEKLIDLVTETLKYRQENNIVRNDFLHILFQLSKTDKTFSELDATSHAAGFFADGYESSSIVMHFILFLLASKDAQVKLREEINAAFDENDNLPYDELLKLPYLDAVFNETIRLHPPGGSLNKVCTKTYTYVPKSETCVIKEPVVIEKGTPVIFPLYALHRDPKYFDEPNSFKPERFLGDRNNIQKYTFLPFGEGPRTCLGQRFGTLQIKIGVAYVIRNFEISVNNKTQLPIKYDPMYFLTLPKHPVWLDFKKI